MAVPDPQIDPHLLGLLLRTRERRPLEAIGRAINATPIQAAQGLEALQAVGCVFDRHPQHGVRLLSTSLACWSSYIEPRHAGRLGHRLSVYRETTSTQDLARQLLRPPPSNFSPDASRDSSSSGPANGQCTHDGHVLVTDHQTAGRGRLERRWTTPPGAALLLTAIVAPPSDHDPTHASVDRLMLAACCSVAEVIESLTGLATTIRWPNDVLVNGRKLAGILVETAASAALIGIGVNVHAAPRRSAGSDLRSPATSLADQGQPLDRLLLLDHILDQLHHALRHRETDDLHHAWRNRAALLQERVTVHTDGRHLTGRVIDLDPAEGLLLQLDRGQVITLPAQTTSLVLNT